MKKIVLLFITIFIAAFTLNVNASQAPYKWSTSNGGDLPTGATQSVEGKVVTLKLNNYNGEGLKLECLGTGQEGMQFIIELTGDNTITDNSIGLNKDLSTSEKFTFKGDGSLIINAPTPISYESYQDSMTIVPSENIYTDNVEAETTKSDALITPAKEAKAEEKEDSDYTVINIAIAAVFGLYVLISLIFIILLISRIPKNK